MSVIQLNLSDELFARAEKIARENSLPVEQVITEALQKMIDSQDGANQLAERARRGRDVDFKAILRKAPDVEPDALDRME